MEIYDYERNQQGVTYFLSLTNDRRVKRFLEAIEKLDSPKVLEVGMGQGQFLKKIAKFRPDLQLFGVDFSRQSIEFATNDKQLKVNLV